MIVYVVEVGVMFDRALVPGVWELHRIHARAVDAAATAQSMIDVFKTLRREIPVRIREMPVAP